MLLLSHVKVTGSMIDNHEILVCVGPWTEQFSSTPASTAVTAKVAMKLEALSVTVKQYTEGRLADSRSMFSAAPLTQMGSEHLGKPVSGERRRVSGAEHQLDGKSLLCLSMSEGSCMPRSRPHALLAP